MADIDGQEEMFGGANVSKIEDGDILASLSAWARIFGTERETLRRRLLAANVTSKGERHGHPVYGGRDVVSAWLSGPEARIDPDSLSPFQRRAWYQGEHEKLKLQVERSELVPMIEVEETIGKVAKALVLGLDTLIDTIERDVGLNPLQAVKMEKHVDRVRESIYQAIAGEPDAEAPPAKVVADPPQKETPAPSGSLIDEAKDYLQKALAKGPKPTAKLIAAAKKAGISEGTLRRAKAQLGKSVTASRQGKGWVWALADSKPSKKRKTSKAAKPRKSRKR